MARHHPKPTALRVLDGTAGKGKSTKNEPKGVGSIGGPPDYFDKVQKAAWFEAVANAPIGVLTGSDRETLVVFIVALCEYRRAVVKVRKRGQVVTTKAGNPVQNPHLSIMNKQALVMLRAAGEMGFSPSSRVRLEITPGTGSGNAFAEFANDG